MGTKEPTDGRPCGKCAPCGLFKITNTFNDNQGRMDRQFCYLKGEELTEKGVQYCQSVVAGGDGRYMVFVDGIDTVPKKARDALLFWMIEDLRTSWIVGCKDVRDVDQHVLDLVCDTLSVWLAM